MIKTPISLLLAVTAGLIGSASALTDQMFMQCNAYRLPNWDDCQTVMDDFKFTKDNLDVVHTNGELNTAPSCMSWWKKGGNCRIHQCFRKANDDNNAPLTVTGGDIFNFYNQIHGDCSNWRAGGYYQNILLPWTIEVYNDEDEGIGGGSDDSNKIRRDGDLMTETKSLAEHEAWRLNSASDGEHESNLRAKRNIEKVTKNKRGDEVKMAVPLSAIGVRNPDAVEQGPRLAKGVGYTYDTTNSQTYGVSATTELGGSWGVFTASVSITASYEKTYSVSQSIKFDVSCDKRGQVTFYPYYDYYSVEVVKNGDYDGRTHEIAWIPVVTGDKISGDIAIACLG